MHMIDYILILLIAAAVVLAVRTAVQRKKAGKTCCGDCAACGGCGGDASCRRSS